MTRYAVLIVEDDAVIAAAISAAAQDRDCSVVGPAASVAQALALVEGSTIDAAVLDANLLDRDVTPVAMALIEQAIPFVIHTGVGLPEELATVFPHVSVIMKPADPYDVIGQLLGQVARLRNGHPNADGITMDSPRSKQIAKIGSTLFAQFGEKAIVLARRQADDAAGPVLESWSEIIADLTARAASGAKR